MKGIQWRITVLTWSLLRLEYSAEGIFEDRDEALEINMSVLKEILLAD